MAVSKTANGWKRILIASDLHGPYLDRKAYKVFLSIATEFPWDQVILNGDVCDFSQISRHDPKIRIRGSEFKDEYGLEEEIFTIQTEIFHPLRRAIGKTPILMRLGNHSMRFDEFASNNTRALLEMLKTIRRNDKTTLEGVLNLDRYDIQLSRKPVDVLYDTFTLIHGVKSGKNVAKQNLLRYGSGTSGHSHRMGVYTEIMHGKLQGWFESGCLRTVHDIEYLPFGDMPDWALGYLELHIHPSGLFHCIPHFIVNYTTIHNGQVFKA